MENADMCACDTHQCDHCVVCGSRVLNPSAENAAYVVFGKVCCSEACADTFRQVELGEQQHFPTYLDYARI